MIKKRPLFYVLLSICLLMFIELFSINIMDIANAQTQLDIYYFNTEGNLCRIKLDGSGNEVLTDWIGKGNFLFSPDGQYIIFQAYKKDNSKEVALLLDAVKLEHKQLMGLTSWGNMIGFSPRGDKVAIIQDIFPNDGIFIMDVNTLEKIKIDYPNKYTYEIRRWDEKKHWKDFGNAFWSEDGNSLYLYFKGFRTISEKKDGIVDKQEFFDLYKLDVKTKEMVLVKNWTIQYTSQEWKDDRKRIEGEEEKIYSYIWNIPRYNDWGNKPEFQPGYDFFSGKSLDGRYSIERRDLGKKLVLIDSQKGKETIIDTGMMYGKGDYSIGYPSWSPDYNYIIYRNLESPIFSLKLFPLGYVSKAYIFVYDVKKKRKYKLIDYHGGFGWYDPNFKEKRKIKSHPTKQ